MIFKIFSQIFKTFDKRNISLFNLMKNCMQKGSRKVVTFTLLDLRRNSVSVSLNVIVGICLKF